MNSHQEGRIAALIALTLGTLLAGAQADSACYYADASRPDDVGEGTSWATAKRTLQAAIDLASDGDTVFVTNGVYDAGLRLVPGNTLSNRVVLEKDVFLRSVNGPAATVIVGAGGDLYGSSNAVRCVFMTHGTLDGFTLRGGATLSTGNITNTCGGGLFARGASVQPVACNCVFEDNRASSGGGAYYGALSGCSFTNNLASSGGGTYYGAQSNCLYVANVATNGGGAYYGTLNACTFNGNAATLGGGTYYGTQNNSLFVGNVASSGGGAYNGYLRACTLYGNCAVLGGGAYLGTLNNCIVWRNTAPGGTLNNHLSATLGWTCTSPLPPGAGNLCADPRLACEESGDFRLLPDSPCLNAGTAAFAAGPQDRVGASRIQDGEPDLGAFEGSAETALAAPNDVTSSQGLFPAIVRVSWSVPAGATHFRVFRSTAGEDALLPVSDWQVATAFEDSSALSTVHYLYWVRAATGDDGTAFSPLSEPCVGWRSFAAECYVDASRPDDSGDGLSWTTAKRTLLGALLAVRPGGAILVTDGVYNAGSTLSPDGVLSNRLVLTNGACLRSVGGALRTVIEGSGAHRYGTNSAVRCVYLGNGILEGFTVRQGATLAGAGTADSRGGGVYAVSATAGSGLRGCLLLLNRAREGGGAYNGTFTDCVFASNAAAFNGGGAAYAALAGCVVASNTSPNGGGVFWGTLTNCLLYTNTAGGNGGGSLNATLNGCVLSNNTAGTGGGGSGGTLIGCTLVGNRANNYGGGANGGTLDGCVLSHNRATVGGGGGSNCTMTNCVLTENLSGSGGGAYRGTLIGCALNGNAATNGGGAYAGALTACALAGNSATSGGGAYAGILRNCRVTDNVASNVGGGTCACTNLNCLLSGNAATVGGGVSSGLMVNCTLVDNLGANGGGAHSCVVSNSVLWGNHAPDGRLDNYQGASLAYSCSHPLPDGPENLNGTPRFVREEDGDYRLWAGSPGLDAGASVAGLGATDLVGAPRIQGTAIDMGAYEGGVAAALGTPEGLAASQGLYTDKVRISWSGVAGATHYRVYRAANAFSAKQPLGAWQEDRDFDDALAIAGEHYFYWVRAASDAEGSEAGPLSEPAEGWRLFGPNWFVDATRLDDNGDGASWATAKRTLQAAVSAAKPGDAILVADGSYDTGGACAAGSQLTNRLVLTNSVTIRSVNGADYTFIVGTGAGRYGNASAVRCVYLSAGILDGFTLTGGATLSSTNMPDSRGGGQYAFGLTMGSALRRCRITGSRAREGGGAYGGVFVDCTLASNTAVVAGGGACYGWFEGCTFASNTAPTGGGAQYGTHLDGLFYTNSASSNGGGTYGSRLTGCILSNNVAANGGGSYGATLDQSVLSGNRATSAGGGAYGCSLSDCLLYSNQSGSGGGSYGSIIVSSSLSNNTATNGGGANATVLNGCSLAGNTARFGGGAYGGALTNCQLTGNVASMTGGGTFTSFASQCLFEQNLATNLSGGAHGGTLANSLLYANAAGVRGGACCTSALFNCTIYGNVAPQGAGVFASRAYNTIIWANTNATGAVLNQFAAAFTNCCVTPLPGGANNLSNEPCFVNVAAADFRLRMDSPCLNAGTTNRADLGVTNASVLGMADYVGNARVQGATIDIGALEGGFIAPQSLTVTSVVERTYGAPPFAPGVTASSGLAVEYASVTPGVVVVTNGLIRLVGAGEATVVASQPGNVVYEPASSVTCTFAVARAPLLITAIDTNRTYGADNPPFALRYEGFAYDDDPSVLSLPPSVWTDACTASPVGAYPVRVEGAAAANYALTYQNATLTVREKTLTVTASDRAKGYGQSLDLGSIAYTAVGLEARDTLTAVSLASAGACTTAAAGLYPIIPGDAQGAGLANYAIIYSPGMLTVRRAPLTVTAEDKKKLYGASVPTLTAHYDGFVNGDGADSLDAPAALDTEVTASSPAGAYAIRAAGAAAANYEINCQPGTLIVDRAPLIITAESKSKVYGAPLPTLTARYNGFVNGDGADCLDAPAALDTAATAASPVGHYVITASGAADANYEIACQPGTLTVSKATLTVIAEDKAKVYGAPVPTLTARYDGFVNGDAAACLDVPATLDTTATAASPAGAYAITASGAAGTNYEIVFAPGTLTVSRAPLSVTAEDKAKVYGAPMPTLTARYDGFVNGDAAACLDVPATLDTTATAASPAGAYAITTSGAAGTNYEIVFAPGTLTVSRAPLSVTAEDKAKVYGAPVPTLTARYDGFVNGDAAACLDVPASLDTAAAASSPAGTYAITASGAADANYEIACLPGTLTISRAPLVVTAADQSKLYGARYVFLGTEFTCAGLFDGDSVTGADLASPATSPEAAIGSHAIAVCAATGAGIENYDVFYSAGRFTVGVPPVTCSQVDGARFTNALAASLSCLGPGTQIRYTLDGLEPDETSLLYTEPLSFTAATTLRARAFHAAASPGTCVTFDFVRLYGLSVAGGVAGGVEEGYFEPGTNLALTAAEPPAGSHFDHWSAVPGEAYLGDTFVYTQAVTAVAMPAYGLALSAEWSPNRYEVVFDPEGGCVSPTTTNVTYGAAYGPLPTASWVGHTFGGWWTGPDGTGTSVTQSTAVTELSNHTLYGRWDFAYTSDGETYTINGYYGTNGTAVVPATIAGLPVNSIGEQAFAGAVSLTNLTFAGGTVTNLARGAFAGCTRLMAVTLPSGLQRIGEATFSGCSRLSGITFPEGVTQIGPAAFTGCSRLTSVTVPAGVTELGFQAFGGCAGLTEISVDPANATFGSLEGVLYTRSFDNLLQCPGGKTGTCTVHVLTAMIANSAFKGCSKLTGVTFPAGLERIGTEAFANCSGLFAIQLPSSAAIVEDAAFSGCSKLASITFSLGLASLGNAAFLNCVKLTGVAFPGSITNIGAAAFRGCSKLASVHLPASVVSLGERAFADCVGLMALTVEAGNPAFCSADGVLFSADRSTLVQYPGGRAGSYTVPAEVTAIGPAAFSSCYGLTILRLPAGVTALGSEVFYNCSALTSLFFQGPAPAAAPDVFRYAYNATAYALPGTAGWTELLAGRAVLFWNPSVQGFGNLFGVRAGLFGFNVVGTANIPFVIEACTDLRASDWVPVQSGTLVNGSFYYADPAWSEHATRYYRICQP